MDSKNNKTSWLQNHLMPVAAKLGQNTSLISLRDGITLAMPLIIVGSIFMIISSFPVPGFDSEELKQVVKLAHPNGALVMSTIGTSQEGFGASFIEQTAIRNKICGVDIQHIGDAAWGIQSPFENIYPLSKAIRGERHTISRMARSINR
ncbi:PEP phosphonomutase-like protein [Lactobacillus hominis DSM 23910 = CRBIP 24.179]|uniref:DUF7916 domain-containing protein n=1 Tax=Lactobacillus hominis DSM 23910 = CRBIP 24.179 TaxID=1423758 RepID=I7L4R9_9LACO|nr:PEP phosphonomutase-like protein [Lactobacillus hominis DSM 23910 = CRBIP 24.179]CCI80922.1 Protein of unknown function [Lactobacillus hominis DSM 23910 = CRBIP 24.179]